MGPKGRLTILKDCLVSCTKKKPQRLRSGKEFTGRYETDLANDQVCFWVEEIEDFVFFRKDQILWRVGKDGE
jgi:hypothetical protein